MLFDKEHLAIKVYFSDRTSDKSRELIRSYLKKLVGIDNIAIGSIIQRDQSAKYLNLLHRYRHEVVVAGLGIIFLCWFIIFFTHREIILEEAYLIEKFQRRNFVGIKIYLGGITSLAVIVAIISRFPLNPHIPWPLLLQITCVLLLTRYKWERI